MGNVSLIERIKNYESSTNYKIIPRLPIIVRLDGKNFSKLTKKLKLTEPFCRLFSEWMEHTMLDVANQLQGCIIGYTQSDEITFVLKNNQTMETKPWFDNRIQKINSIITSMATSAFNMHMWKYSRDLHAYFDCRVFPVPNLIEAANCLIWRQNDCIKNSINVAAYYEISKKYSRKVVRKMMHGLDQSAQEKLLFDELSIEWTSYEKRFKTGLIVVKEDCEITTENGDAIRKKWVSHPAFQFTGQDGRIKLYEILFGKPCECSHTKGD